MAKFNFSKLVPRLQQAALMGAGSVASNMSATALGKMLGANNNPKLNAGVRLAVGAVLPMFLGGGKKESFITHFADGVLAESAVSLAKAFGVPGISGTDDDISGYGEDPIAGTDYGSPAVAGTAN